MGYLPACDELGICSRVHLPDALARLLVLERPGAPTMMIFLVDESRKKGTNLQVGNMTPQTSHCDTCDVRDVPPH